MAQRSCGSEEKMRESEQASEQERMRLQSKTERIKMAPGNQKMSRKKRVERNGKAKRN